MTRVRSLACSLVVVIAAGVAADAQRRGGPPRPSPAEKASARRYNIGILRADGKLIPFAHYDSGEFKVIWSATERDTPQVLKEYMGNFDPSFLALRGEPEQLAAVAKDFKIYYKKVDGKTPTSYTMDHSAGSYVYDPSGRLRVYHRYGTGVQVLGEDVRTLLREAG